MTKLHLTPAQKAKLQGAGKKAMDLITSGKAATVTSQATRFVQGKPVIIKKPNTSGVKKTIQIFGYELPQGQVLMGGAGLALGVYLLVNHHKHQ